MDLTGGASWGLGGKDEVEGVDLEGRDARGVSALSFEEFRAISMGGGGRDETECSRASLSVCSSSEADSDGAAAEVAEAVGSRRRFWAL